VRLIQKYGPNILNELQEAKNSIAKFTPTDLQELIQNYNRKVAEFAMLRRTVE
jgi:hypothetical protein